MDRLKPGEVFRVAFKGEHARVPPGDVPEDKTGKDILPRHWFCVCQSASGEITKKESNTLSSLREMCESATLGWIDFWTDDFSKNALPAATHLGFSNNLVSSFISEYLTPYLDFDTEIGLQVPSVHVRGFEVKSFPLLILVKKNLILTIHPFSPDRRFALLRRYSDIFIKKIPVKLPQVDKLTIFLMRILDENNDRNFEELRKIEECGDQLSERLSDPDTPRQSLATEIYSMKHALITYLNELWDTLHVLNTLRYGDAKIISSDQSLLDRIGLLGENVNRQIGLSEHLSEVLASGLEVLQTIYNNQLQSLANRLALIITYLTIIGTAILVPNTLATMFGNGVFTLMPKDIWWYVPLMIFATLLTGWAAYWWVKKQGWLKKVQ